MTPEATSRLQDYLARALPADAVALSDWRHLSGGAVQQNWGVQAVVQGGPQAGAHHWVLRTDSAVQLDQSRSRAEEFALLVAAQAAGVAVAPPLLCCDDAEVTGAPFFIMGHVDGIATAHRIVRDDALAGGRGKAVAALGRQLARIHSIRPPRADLPFLGPVPSTSPTEAAIAHWRAALDRQGVPRPILEWGLRALECAQPAPGEIVLCHNDFRSGNFMFGPGGVAAVLDWEFSAWGDPHEDMGWLCARCWRFGNDAMVAGGIGTLEDFAAAYTMECGRAVDAAAVAWWSLLGTIRWAVIAAEQAQRHISGRERSLELALTGHMVPELEADVLRQCARFGDAAFEGGKRP